MAEQDAGQAAVEVISARFDGWWWDEFWEPDPQTGVLVKKYETQQKKNTRMDSAPTFFAFLAAGTNPGIQYHAQGLGSGGWGDTPPAVSTSDTTLFSETDRRAPDSIAFLDGADLVVAGPTNRIRIRTTYGIGVLPGVTIREQGLFGNNATATPNSGRILNVIRHPGLFKSGAISLVRNIKLIFS